MKFALILMIKNEEKILKRCLEAVEKVVDCFCICDTGSTDSTQEVAKEFLKTRTGCLTIEPWQNFGHNRTVSFVNAQTYVKELGWNLEETYGILLDADMMFVPGKLRQQKLGAIGYKIIQKNANLEYYNTRIIRMDYAWKCLGVTHEYWDGPSDNLEKDVCFIDDRDDGGCKHDKFERDAKLLEDGLAKEPENVRYMFYLAQTYKCVGRFADAITMYKKRIKAGGWAEEIWNAHYSIGDCYLKLKNIPKFEEWMQKAHAYRPCRTESIYSLAKYFREVGQHYKSYHYIKIGVSVPFPKDDVLFIESDVYRGLFNYECSIVEYYIHHDRCLRTTIDYMLKLRHFQDNCVSNLKFSVKPLKDATYNKLDLPSPFGQVFTPSAISLCDYPMANVRYVNYKIQPDGSYVMPNGIVVTKNAYVNLETNEFSIMEEPLVNFETHIRGLEDLRLYKNPNGKLCFTATSFKQFIHDKISIVHGEYDLETKSYKNYEGVQSPSNSDCEKNWVNVPGTDDFIYSWSPLRVGKIRNDKFLYSKEISTPPLFSLFRGSASPIEVNGRWLVLVHFVEYCQPRKYYHCFVELEKESYTVLRVSLPFVFQHIGIEYCISGRLVEDSLEYYFSSWDKDPSKVEFKVSTIEWVNLDQPIIQEKNNIVRVPSNLKAYWDGGYSKCLAGGSIETYVNKSINAQGLNASGVFLMSDGIVEKTEFNNMESQLGRKLLANTTSDDFSRLMLSAKENTTPVVSMLCSRSFIHPNLLLLPLDDDTFHLGLNKVLANIHSPKWDDRKNIVFWRGGSSGMDRPSIRMKVVDKLFKNAYADVKLTKWGNWENEHFIPEEHFGDRCGLDKHFNYKYILIVDGNLIASNHQWVFGSGSVPIMITHPGNNWWFKKYLVPMKHYVPVSYDLSDLEEKIEWLVQNDDKAREISLNALEFSKEKFSPKFQQKYIDEQIKQISLNSVDISNYKMERLYTINSSTPSDINEHLPTLFEYAKKCDSIIECGVREICSSYAFASGLKGNPNNSYILVDPYKSKKIDGFLQLCADEGVNARFIEQSDLECPLVKTDLLFIDTWHIYGQLKRELAYWHSSVNKYIIMHDTTVDEWLGETIRAGSNGVREASESGFPHSEIMRGLWPAIDEFLKEHPEWKLEMRYTNNNGLTILARV